MEWNNNIINSLKWSAEIINREGKEKVAAEIAAMMKDGDIIGVGSGSTVYVALLAIAKRLKKENLNIQVIPSSMEISMTCIQLGIPQTTLSEKKPDWTFDGADEVDPDRNLIKGRGGAMFKEKLLICNSTKTYIIVDESKFVARLGEKFPVPIEVFPAALVYADQRIKELGARDVILRMAKGKDGPIITENGNFILDAWFDAINPSLESQIKNVTGVIESGLFIGYDVGIISI
ncbi:ribose 5-phosphate isomerase A [Dysgonomonas sp. PFB1-18]|uniref:ribose 5-phosphate isomerase A n=1 Tax=unclassified Dysgonomonas TaxID=2630389 RepID=UPI002476D2E3|nr:MULTISPECIES: ribose 5-phosphate isomerase A [unclassified Dysgonomonas]MDH6310444.1 ribose 5-phosphate isomerase A [Dysgonomonas sp. PF1-14]MDH6340755.1 ribose 5-phosphate isomerase A [Dysgonomonas sp. PF1-16]MDH6382375.1 ribose 5-phosphate isomerase A [Dysgonomonas sp. PFB1-18]MDH6399724.1 ribose 5-phosphate isomerase A [Dysgonomonas sp. PF1-23]